MFKPSPPRMPARLIGHKWVTIQGQRVRVAMYAPAPSPSPEPFHEIIALNRMGELQYRFPKLRG